jgi:hypothetical protein
MEEIKNDKARHKPKYKWRVVDGSQNVIPSALTRSE